MKSSRFNPAKPLIFVTGRVWGPLGNEQLSLVLDTGASMTLITPEVLDGLGYNPRDGVARTYVTSATSRDPGYNICVSRFAALGSGAPTSSSTPSISPIATISTG